MSVFNNKAGTSHSVYTFNDVKMFDFYELDPKCIYFVASAVRLQRPRPHMLLIGCDI